MFLGLDRFEGFPHLYYAREFGQHSLVTGVSGIGKTTLLAILACQIAKLGIYIFMVDSEKKEESGGKSLSASS